MAKKLNEFKEKRSVTLWISKDLAERADRLAEKGGITRTKLLSNLAEIGIDELERLDSWGMMVAVRVFEEMKEKLKVAMQVKKGKGSKLAV